MIDGGDSDPGRSCWHRVRAFARTVRLMIVALASAQMGCTAVNPLDLRQPSRS
jgi:hypothetical protein